MSNRQSLCSKDEALEYRRKERRILENQIILKASSSRPLNILEAGCGRSWQLNLQSIYFRLTGVDVNRHVLETRKMTKRDLDEAIVGDLRHIELPEEHYDVIYSSFVLEHIRGAEQVLLNFIKWLAPGGIMIVRIPDRNSVLGFLTRIAPFWFHVFYYRHIKGDKEAGRPGRGPFPTFYDRIVSSNGIRAFCRQQGLIIAEEYLWRFHTRRRGRLISFEKLLFKLISLMSFRRLHCEYHNMTYIIEKPT